MDFSQESIWLYFVVFVMCISCFFSSLSVFIRLFSFQKLKKKLKGAYVYVVNLIAMAICLSVVLPLLYCVKSDTSLLVYEIIIVLSVVFYTNDIVIKRFYKKNNDKFLGKDRFKIIQQIEPFIILCAVWIVYIASTIVNELIRFKVINGVDTDLNNILQLNESAMIIAIAVVAFIDVLIKYFRAKKEVRVLENISEDSCGDNNG